MSSAALWSGIRKYGENASITVNGGQTEDIWTPGGLYAFPAAAASTTVVCADADDTDGGSGAHSVMVEGLDTNWNLASEAIALNGGTVTLDTEFLRVNRAYVTAAGASETNEGNIEVKHGATVLARIDATFGQTLMAIFSTPQDWHEVYIRSWGATMGRPVATASMRLTLWQRPFGGAFRVVDSGYANSSGNSWVGHVYGIWEQIAPRTDVLLRASDASAAGLFASGRFELVATLGDNTRARAWARTI